MKEYIGYILGVPTAVWYLAAFTFVFFGHFIRWSVSANYGVRKNPNTPNTFSLRYWWNNNGRRELLALARTIVISFTTLRFATEWFKIEPSLAFACGIGIMFDLIIYFYKKKSEATNINDIK